MEDPPSSWTTHGIKVIGEVGHRDNKRFFLFTMEVREERERKEESHIL